MNLVKSRRKKLRLKLDKNRIVENIIVMVFGSVIIFALFIFFIYALSPNILRVIVDTDRISSFTDDDYVIYVTRLCDLPKDNLDKFLCVSDFFELVYDFNHTKGIKSPEEMMKTGGDCLDSAYFYCAVFDNYDGFECQVVQMDNINHAANVVTFDDKYCWVDQSYVQCVLTGSGGVDYINEQSIKV